MKMNGVEVNGTKFAYDDCHQMCVIEDTADLEEAKEIGYDIYPIKDLPTAYENSCELRFISN